MYALFYNGHQVSKSHSTKEAVIVEAAEQRALVKSATDFPGTAPMRQTISLPPGYEIRELKDD